MKKNLSCLLLLFVPLFFCAAQVEEGMAGRLSSISSSLSAAHISLAPGTRIRVTNLETGRSIAVIVSRRLSADSTHIVELTAPVANAIGMQDEARVRVELLNSEGTSTTASGSSRAGTGAAESRDSRGPGAEGTPREPVSLPSVRVSRARRDAITEQEIEDEDNSREFYYINSYEGEYPGDPEDTESPEPPLSRESGPSQGDIVTLPPETDKSAPPPAAPPPQRRPVPPPPADPPPPAQTVSPASPSAARPAQPAVPPAQPRPAPQARPVQPVVTPAQTPVPPPASPPAQARSAPPASSPRPGSGTASAQVALPADTDRVVLSMSRDESGKLWVYVESETAREIAVTEVPRSAPIQAPVPDQAQPPTAPRQVQAPPSSVPAAPPHRVQTPPPAQVQAPPPPPPPPAPQRRRVTVTVIPRLPPPGDGKRYILQVGSYRDRGTAEYRLFKLQNAGIDAVMEPHDAAIRIIINGVYAEEIPALAEKLGKAGVTEIWVRER